MAATNVWFHDSVRRAHGALLQRSWYSALQGRARGALLQVDWMRAYDSAREFPMVAAKGRSYDDVVVPVGPGHARDQPT